MTTRMIYVNTSFSLGPFSVERKKQEQERLAFLTPFMKMYEGDQEIRYVSSDVGVGATVTRRGKYQMGVSIQPGLDLLVNNSFNCSIHYSGPARHKHIYDALVDIMFNGPIKKTAHTTKERSTP